METKAKTYKIALIFLIIAIMFHSSSLTENKNINLIIFLSCISFSLLLVLLKKILIKDDTFNKFIFTFSILITFSLITSFWSIQKAQTLGASINLIIPSILVLFISIEIGKKISVNEFTNVTFKTFLFVFLIFSINSIFTLENERLKGMFDNSNQLGMLTAFIFILMINNQIREQKVMRSLPYIFIYILIIIGTFSRGSILMMGIGITVIALTTFIQKRTSLIKKITVFALYSLGVTTVLIVVIGSRGIEIDRRFQLFELGKSIINLEGHGYGTTGYILASFGMPWFNSWHNTYIGLLVEGGLIWLVIGLYLLFKPLLQFFKYKTQLNQIDKNYWLNSILGIVLATMASQYFEFQLLRNTPFFYLYVTFLGIITVNIMKESERERNSNCI
ncbi:hypothetical protein [Exiguobacterium acetylicum]|uniref:hypothetical protein n=1 Tax=Exiguobacterium acetylicum TaxID=41170 RepID=UPI001CA722A6|nr:hypothetical protein [Exiguobacterium acetylicum]QZY86423.1 hypothetical protein K7G97_14330 [Exiguobacterium acetylicum]